MGLPLLMVRVIFYDLSFFGLTGRLEKPECSEYSLFGEKVLEFLKGDLGKRYFAPYPPALSRQGPERASEVCFRRLE